MEYDNNNIKSLIDAKLSIYLSNYFTMFVQCHRLQAERCVLVCEAKLVHAGATLLYQNNKLLRTL